MLSYFARLLGSYRLLPRVFASDDLAFKEFSLSLLHSRKVASLFIDKMTSNSTLKPTRHVKYYWFHIPISEFWMQPERLFCLVCLLGSHKTLYCIYSQCKLFIMSTEFDKNISDWRYDCTDYKNDFDFFLRLVKWPKIAVKKCQNLIFKVNFQGQKSSGSF